MAELVFKTWLTSLLFTIVIVLLEDGLRPNRMPDRFLVPYRVLCGFLIFTDLVLLLALCLIVIWS